MKAILATAVKNEIELPEYFQSGLSSYRVDNENHILLRVWESRSLTTLQIEEITEIPKFEEIKPIRKERFDEILRTVIAKIGKVD